MRTRTTFAAAFVIATLGLAVAACGGGSGAGSSGLGGAASVAPSNAVGFVALDTNVSSSQWQTVDGLLKKFPSQGDLMTKLQQSFEQHTKLNWTTDVQPALGSEPDLIALPPKKPHLVGLTQPADQTKPGRLPHEPVPVDLYASSLVDEIPSGAILAADFPVAPGQFEFSPGSTSRLVK